MARKCKRHGYKTVIQDYGPAKKVRVCRSYKGGKSSGGKGGKGWCVYRGKRKGRVVSCHVKKRAANRVARLLRKTCKTRIRVKRSKRAA